MRPRLIMVLLWIAVVAIVAYWSIWFLGDRSWIASVDSTAYDMFENAFPVADGWLAFTCAAAALALRAGKPTALLWLLAAGSASIYLGCMDVTFDLENGVYGGGALGAVIAELVINAASFALGAYALWFGWAHRRTFVA